MAMQALRVVGLAFIELSFDQWNQNFANDESEMLPRCDPNEPYYLCTSKMFEEKLGSNEPFFTWLGAIGMKDPLRAGVTESIKYARNEAQLDIRLISGDHIETAKAVALKCGIIREKENIPNAVMDGATELIRVLLRG